jgi:hypothetical protein
VITRFLQLTSLTMLLLSAFVFVAPPAMAKTAAECQKGSFFGLPTWYKNFNFDDECTPRLPQSSGKTDVGKTVSAILLAVFEILLRIGGLVAVGFVIVGGFKYITSQGEPERAKNARGTILNAVIGLVITLVAAPLVSFLATRLIQ